MAKKSWTFELDQKEHTIDLEHSSLWTKRRIYLDGILKEEKTSFFDIGSRNIIQIGRHTCTVLIGTNNGLTYNYDLLIDEVSVKTGKEKSPAEPLPSWLWALLLIYFPIIISIVFDVAVSIVIVGLGFFPCAIVGWNKTLSKTAKISICAVITVVSYISVYFLVLRPFFESYK